MTNRIVKALEGGAEKLGKTLAKDASKAIQDLYHGAGTRLKKVATNHVENDAKHAAELEKILKGGKEDLPHAPGGTPGGGRPRAGSGSAEGGARTEAESGHPHDKTRTENGKCTDGTDPVDLASGRVFLNQSDIALPGVLPLVFTRMYESSTRLGRHLGPSWSSLVDQRLEIDDEGIVFVTDTGMVLRYAVPETGERVLPKDGPRWPLMRTVQGDWAVSDPDTGRTRYFSDALHAPGLALPDEITDRNGNRISFDYADETGIPYAVRHSAGHELKLTCDKDGRLTALHLVGAAEDGSDRLVKSYGHDAAGDLVTVTSATGATTRFEYDAEHRMTAWIDSNGFRYEYTYDHRHRCVAQSGADGQLANRFTYGEPDTATGHRTTTLTDGQGAATRYLFDARLQVIAVTDPLGHTTRTARDAMDRATAITDPLGHVTRYAYDDYGRLTAVTHPDGTRSTATYNDLGLPVVLTEPDGSVWRQEYDARGNRTARIDPTGATTVYAYDASGGLSSVTDALGHTVRVRCDAAGLPETVTDPLGAVTQYRRDRFGRVLAVVDPLGATTRYAWTDAGELAACTDPTGATQEWTYDGEGNCLTRTDALGRTTRFEYAPFDVLAARTDPDGVRHTFTHDARLRLTQVTNPQGLTWDYTYDAAGHLISERDFDDRTLAYGHDANGRLVSRTNALGVTTTYQYDPLGRIRTKDTAGRRTTYSHDAAGVLLEIAGPDATVTYRRDALGLVTAETVNGRTVTTTYDPLGRPIRRTTPIGATTTHTYDAAGNRTVLNASGHTLTFAHDRSGRESHRRLADSVTLASTWDPAGRLATQVLTLERTATPLQRRTYAYAADGNLLAAHDQLADRTRRFTHDAAGRVVTVQAADWSESYAYDEAGNQSHAAWPDRHPGSAARGDRNYTGTRLTRAGAVRYEHDALGRVTLRRRTRLSRKPDTWHYAWDAEDRLVGVTTPDGTRWRYRYDPLGRRIAKEQLAPDGSTVVERTLFTWDGPVLVEQTTSTPGNPRATALTWDHSGLVPVAQTERKVSVPAEGETGAAHPAHAPQSVIDERFFAIVTDLVGTPTELVAESGDIAWHARATLWGTTTWNRHATAYTPLRFPGQYFDPETALHYNYFRHYDPETGRYLSADPLGLEPGPNPTSYVPNPHTAVDPLGLSACNTAAQADLAKMRSEMGVPAIANDTQKPMSTLGRLDMDGHDPLYGQNGRLPRPAPYPGAGNGISRLSFEDHAEGDVFSQAKARGQTGGTARLYLDRDPCNFCRNSMAGYGRWLDVDSLHVYGPNGLHGTYTRGGKYVLA
ncbi:RHS repeat-associated core domain-containing protein [Streptomyces noursei]|uniref:RHS repeat-associated core domain-containing protein n=1 Tax=Streptomyces noursei TaxID=1971 RepID=UPI000C99811B|nr:RHS repeat-associated core domain-containing protein [Streptomyces noursei]